MNTEGLTEDQGKVSTEAIPTITRHAKTDKVGQGTLHANGGMTVIVGTKAAGPIGDEPRNGESTAVNTPRRLSADWHNFVTMKHTMKH